MCVSVSVCVACLVPRLVCYLKIPINFEQAYLGTHKLAKYIHSIVCTCTAILMGSKTMGCASFLFTCIFFLQYLQVQHIASGQCTC